MMTVLLSQLFQHPMPLESTKLESPPSTAESRLKSPMELDRPHSSLSKSSIEMEDDVMEDSDYGVPHVYSDVEDPDWVPDVY